VDFFFLFRRVCGREGEGKGVSRVWCLRRVGWEDGGLYLVFEPLGAAWGEDRCV